jgi:hypothetical protein
MSAFFVKESHIETFIKILNYKKTRYVDNFNTIKPQYF